MRALVTSYQPGPARLGREAFLSAVLAVARDPKWGRHQRPNGRLSDDILAFLHPAQGEPYQIYDVLTGEPGLERVQWLDQTLTAEAGSLFAPIEDLRPMPVERLRVVGTAFAPSDVRWVGLTSFDLPRRVRQGNLRWIDLAADHGVTVLRIIPATVSREPWSLAEGWQWLPATLDAVADAGLWAEVVIGVDTAWYHLTRDDLLTYMETIGGICAQYPGTLIELASENSHPSQISALRDPQFLAELRARVPREIPVSLGSTHGGERPVYFGGDYWTHHGDRSKSPEANAAIMAAAQLIAGKPGVDDEALGIAEQAMPGKRTADPAYAERQAAAARTERLAGSTLHLDAGLWADVDRLGPVQREALRRFTRRMWEGP